MTAFRHSAPDTLVYGGCSQRNVMEADRASIEHIVGHHRLTDTVVQALYPGITVDGPRPRAPRRAGCHWPPVSCSVYF